MAHVEAPTFGSIILAGVLLKLGGVGMLRLSSFVCQSSMIQFISGYLLVGLAFVTIICCFQSDFKRLIAYRRVSHIIALPPLLVFDTFSSNQAVLLLMVFHGLSSPLLFMLVGVSYSFYSTRQFVFIRGFLLVSPLISFFLVLSFLFTMSAPPFPSFVREVMFIISTIPFSFLFVYPIYIFTFFSIVYSLLWLGSMVFNPSQPTSPLMSVAFSSVAGLFFGLFVRVIFLVLIRVLICVSILYSFNLVFFYINFIFNFS